MTQVRTSGRPRGVPPASAPETVPFFDQSASFQALWPITRSHVENVFDQGVYSNGHKVAELEAALAEWTGARYAVGVNSATDALVLLMKACGLRPGDEVIVPAFSFIATASSVVLAGGRPVFADIEPATYGIDVASAVAAVTARTRMIMPVHLFCQLADMSGVLEAARQHRLTVVEDSAEAFGMSWGGVHAGRLGAGGVLSFFPTKTLGALGDAGAVITDDPQIAETVAMLRNHGRPGRRTGPSSLEASTTLVPGFNSKMDDLQAAVLLSKLTRIRTDIARRGELAAAYTQRLQGIPGILRLPTVVERDAVVQPVFYVYVIEVERRDELAAYLTADGVGTEVYYPTPLHLQPCFRELGHAPGDFPHAEAACARTIALPLYPDLTMHQVDRVCEAVRVFCTGSPA